MRHRGIFVAALAAGINIRLVGMAGVVHTTTDLGYEPPPPTDRPEEDRDCRAKRRRAAKAARKGKA